MRRSKSIRRTYRSWICTHLLDASATTGQTRLQLLMGEIEPHRQLFSCVQLGVSRCLMPKRPRSRTPSKAYELSRNAGRLVFSNRGCLRFQRESGPQCPFRCTLQAWIERSGAAIDLTQLTWSREHTRFVAEFRCPSKRYAISFVQSLDNQGALLIAVKSGKGASVDFRAAPNFPICSPNRLA